MKFLLDHDVPAQVGHLGFSLVVVEALPEVDGPPEVVRAASYGRMVPAAAGAAAFPRSPVSSPYVNASRRETHLPHRF
jgi:hypothetical protein